MPELRVIEVALGNDRQSLPLRRAMAAAAGKDVADCRDYRLAEVGSPGCAVPTAWGSRKSYYHTTTRYPVANRRVYGKPVYHGASWYTVVVDIAWALRHHWALTCRLVPTQQLGPILDAYAARRRLELAAACLGLAPDTPAGMITDALMDHGVEVA